MGVEQFWLPRFQQIPVVERVKQSPQPDLEYYTPPTAHEILYHDLELNFRGRLNEWLKRTQVESNFALEEVLPERDVQRVRLYLNPQPPDGDWLNQSEVMAQVTGDPKTAMFKELLLNALVRIWRRNAIGPRATEILKLSNFLYFSLIDKQLVTIDQIREANAEQVQLVCGAREMFEDLKQHMQEHFPNWSPEVVFRQELEPKEAFHY